MTAMLARWNNDWFVAFCREDGRGVQLKGGAWPYLREHGFVQPRPEMPMSRWFDSPEGIEFFPEARLHGGLVSPQSLKLDTDERLVLVIWIGPGPPPYRDTWEFRGRDEYLKYVPVGDLELTRGRPPERAFASVDRAKTAEEDP